MLGLGIMHGASNGAPAAGYGRVATCMSVPQPPGGWAGLRARVAQVRAIAPGTRGESGPWDHSAGCAGWPVESLPQVRTARTTVPVLVVTIRHNLYSPRPLAAAVARQFDTATVLDNDDDGRLAYLQSPCVQREVNDYLTSGLPPAPGTVCTAGRSGG